MNKGIIVYLDNDNTYFVFSHKNMFEVFFMSFVLYSSISETSSILRYDSNEYERKKEIKLIVEKFYNNNVDVSKIERSNKQNENITIY